MIKNISIVFDANTMDVRIRRARQLKKLHKIHLSEENASNLVACAYIYAHANHDIFWFSKLRH